MQVLKYEELNEPGYNKLHVVKLIYILIHQEHFDYELLFSMLLEHNDLKVLKREDIYELGCNKLHELKLFFLPNYQNPVNNDLPFSIWLEFNVITLLQE